jgi:hypothetical protein
MRLYDEAEEKMGEGKTTYFKIHRLPPFFKRSDYLGGISRS